MAETPALSIPYERFHRGGTPPPGKALVADLLALRELQTSLGLEQTTDAVLRVGINAIVEILAVECGLVLLEADDRNGALRVGWCQGRVMPVAEADLLERALAGQIGELRSGRQGSLLLATAAGSTSPGLLPDAVRALGYGAILALGLGSGGRRTGAMILVAREAGAFSGEPMILAEILAAEMSDHVERIRLRAANGAAGGGWNGTGQDEAGALVARNAQLEAQAAIAAAAAPGLDAERQVEMALGKAIELGAHAAGAVYLVETSDAGDDVLRFARGQGDPAWLDLARLPRWRRGEGLPGRVWDTATGVAFGEIAQDPSGFGLETLRRAGYRRMCCEPLRARGRVIGILELFGSEARPYDERERGLLRAIADQVGTTIHNARLLADVMRHSLDLEWQVERLDTQRAKSDRDRRSFTGLLNAASAEHETELRAAAILDRLIEITNADAAALLATVTDDSPGLRLVAQRGFPDEAANGLYLRPADDPVLGRGLEGPGASLVDLADEACCAAGWPRHAGYRHAAVAPCRSGGVARGVILLAGRYAGTLDEAARATIEAVSGLAALVLESTRHPEPATAGSGTDAADVAALPRPAADAPVSAAAPSVAPSPDLLAQAQKMESLGRLAPGVGHNLNNTLAAIMGHASHIRSLVPDHNPVHDKAAVIEEQAQRAADLVRSVMAFSHGATGRKVPIDLSPLITETLTLLSRTIDPSVVLEARCAPSLPPVEADPGEMRQVLLNLAVNARDAMPDGGRIVFETRPGHLDEQAVASIPGLEPGDYLSIVVSDNGCGMEPEVLARAFDPFFTTKPAAQGSGLGLTVVREIVRRHGGHVAVSSAPGVGTAIRLYLPIAPRVAARGGIASDTAGLEVEAATRDPEGPGDRGSPPADLDGREETAPAASMQTRPLHDAAPGTRVLVVDDETVLREMTAEMLRSRGYEVLLAGDGIEALEIYRREWGKVSLVVLDMIMPRLGGLETFRRLVGMDRKARVLLCSGHANSQQAHQAVLEGAIGLLPKPFGMAELIGWVERGLRN